MMSTATTIKAAPARMKGRRRPNRLVERSLTRPTSGWTKKPEMGPQSQMMLAKAWGMPSSWTYGVRRDSWSDHPNCMPPATEVTLSSVLSETRGRTGGAALDGPGWRGLDRRRLVSGCGCGRSFLSLTISPLGLDIFGVGGTFGRLGERERRLAMVGFLERESGLIGEWTKSALAQLQS